MPAIIKGASVFAVALALSWAVAAAVCTIPLGARLLRGQRRTAMATARTSTNHGAVKHSES